MKHILKNKGLNVIKPSYLEEKIWKLQVLLGLEGYRFLHLFAWFYEEEITKLF